MYKQDQHYSIEGWCASELATSNQRKHRERRRRCLRTGGGGRRAWGIGRTVVRQPCPAGGWWSKERVQEKGGERGTYAMEVLDREGILEVDPLDLKHPTKSV